MFSGVSTIVGGSSSTSTSNFPSLSNSSIFFKTSNLSCAFSICPSFPSDALPGSCFSLTFIGWFFSISSTISSSFSTACNFSCLLFSFSCFLSCLAFFEIANNFFVSIKTISYFLLSSPTQSASNLANSISFELFASSFSLSASVYLLFIALISS